MLANEFLAFEHSPLFFVDIIIHCSLLRTCRVRVEEKEEFLVYTVLWTLTCHPYLESATALSDYYYYKEKERKVNFRTRFFLMLANEFLAFEHSPLFFVDIIIHCSLLRTCRVRVEEKEEFLVYTVLWTLTCHPYLESATALSDSIVLNYLQNDLCSYIVLYCYTCSYYTLRHAKIYDHKKIK